MKGPKCPNHGCYLEGIGSPIPEEGVGRCPVSGASFSFRADQKKNKQKLGIDGQMHTEEGYELIGSE